MRELLSSVCLLRGAHELSSDIVLIEALQCFDVQWTVVGAIISSI